MVHQADFPAIAGGRLFSSQFSVGLMHALELTKRLRLATLLWRKRMNSHPPRTIKNPPQITIVLNLTSDKSSSVL